VLWAIVDPLMAAVAFVLALMPPPKADGPDTVFLMIREFVTVSRRGSRESPPDSED